MSLSLIPINKKQLINCLVSMLERIIWDSESNLIKNIEVNRL